VCSGLLRHRHIAGGLTHALLRCGYLAGRLCLHSRSLSLRVSHATGTVRDLLLCGGETLLSATHRVAARHPDLVGRRGLGLEA
ncbi:hypothetical protein KBZ21_39640, partial [Streptomyces sp. A73]|nr:hypothetical protein [Streptomyces sp. A73]